MSESLASLVYLLFALSRCLLVLACGVFGALIVDGQNGYLVRVLTTTRFYVGFGLGSSLALLFLYLVDVPHR
jgi:hypothetical protein